MSVRDATVSDALAIAGVQVASWQAAYRLLLPHAWLQAMSVEDHRARWVACIDQGRSAVKVALEDDAVIGFSVSGASQDTDADAHTHERYAIYVHPDHWSRGHGWRLWQTVRRSALNADAGKCTLWVIAGNERGARFYERVGFTLEKGFSQGFDIAGVRLREVRYVHLLAEDDASLHGR